MNVPLIERTVRQAYFSIVNSFFALLYDQLKFSRKVMPIIKGNPITFLATTSTFSAFKFVPIISIEGAVKTLAVVSPFTVMSLIFSRSFRIKPKFWQSMSESTQKHAPVSTHP